MVYVDAENICVSELSYHVKSVKDALLDDEVLSGKFYGNTNISPEVMRFCYESGFDYVETSSLVAGHKNVADMKLVVDCITDAVTISTKKSILLLSRDCDFTPLIYKLRSLDIQVEAPLMNSYTRNFTIGDLNLRLEQLGFNPTLKGKEAFKNQMCNIRKLVGKEFSDDTIVAYLNRKKRKFIQSIAIKCNSAQQALLSDIPVELFCFGDVIKYTNIAENSEELINAARLYTLKFFGVSFKDKDIEYFVKSYIRELGING